MKPIRNMNRFFKSNYFHWRDRVHCSKAQKARDPVKRTYHNMKHWDYFNKAIEAEK